MTTFLRAIPSTPLYPCENLCATVSWSGRPDGNTARRVCRPVRGWRDSRRALAEDPRLAPGLYGLWQSLKQQGRTGEAADVELRFRTAWVDADVDLTSSRF